MRKNEFVLTPAIGNYFVGRKELVNKESRGRYNLLDTIFGQWVKQKYVISEV